MALAPPAWADWKVRHAGRPRYVRYPLAIEWALEWFYYRLRSLALFDLLELAGRCTVLVIAIFWLLESDDRTKERHYRAWELINSARGSTGDGGRKDALQDLNRDGVSLAGAPLEKAFLPAVTLAGADLGGANLEGAILDGANLEGADLWRANLKGAELTGAQLKGANLGGIHMNKGDPVLRARFKSSFKLQESLLEGNPTGLRHLQERARGANLEGAILDGANLEGADLWRANLERAQLSGGANLKGAQLLGANLKRANLWGANLEGAILDGANLEGAILDGANLRAAELTEANFDGAVLVRVNLEGATLWAANLKGATMGVTFGGASLWAANLKGTYLKGAKNLTQEQLNAATGDERTQLPEGLTRPEHWNAAEEPPPAARQ